MNVRAVLLKFVVSAFASVALAAPAMAVVDQDFSASNAGFCGGAQCTWQQSFTAGLSGQLSGLQIFAHGDAVDLRIGTGPGPVSNGWLAQLTGVSTSGMIDLSSYHINVSAGQTYVFDVHNGQSGYQGSYVPGGDMAGALFLNYGNTSYSPYPDWNLSYVTNVTPVPEPEAFGMLLAGLGLLTAVARRKTKA